jgi:hypothetical protein
MITFGDDDQRAIRWEKRRLRLGDSEPRCDGCGFDDFRALWSIRKRNSQRLRTICANDRLKEQSTSQGALANKLRRFAQTGYDDPACLLCHEGDLRTLQLHHLAAEANSNLIVPLCGNCHAIVSDKQEDLPTDLRLRDPDRRPLALQAAFNFGLAILTGIISIDSTNATETALLAIITAALIAWAVWDLAADTDFATRFGADYSVGVPAMVPR